MINDNREICRELGLLFKSLSPHKVCRYLLMNKLDFYYVTYCANDASLRILQMCGEHFRDSIRGIRLVTRTITFLDDLLKREGIEYVLIKTYRPLPYVPNDIDVLIHEEDFVYLTKLLGTRGFKIMQRGVEVRFLRGDMTRIDIYSSIIYTGVEFNIKNQLFSTRTYVKFLGDHNLPIPSPELDTLVLLLHDMLGHRTFNYLDYYYVRYYLLKNLTSNTILDFLNNNTRDADLAKRCIALFLSLERKGTFKNMKNFPITFNPSLILNMMFGISLQKRILYSSSLLIDAFLHLYDNYRDAVPRELEKVIQTILFYHRLIVGDRHITW